MSSKARPVKYLSEWQRIYSDPWLLSLVSWLPPLCFLIVYLIFSQGLARELPIGIVDLDQSSLSRNMTRNYDASPTLLVTNIFLSPREGISALRGGGIYGLVLFPENMEKEAILGQTPKVDAFFNNQFLLIGKLVKSAILSVHATTVAQVDTRKNLSTSTPVIGQAMGAAIPIGSQMTPLFNLNTNYAQFLVSAIIPATWQIFIVMTTVLCIAAELRRDGLSVWLGSHPVQTLFLKLAPYTLLFWLHGISFLLGMFVFLGWPMHGNLGYLIFCQLLTVCACQAAGALIFFVSKDPARSLGLAAAYAAPGLAFMGVTFPATDMTLPARIWRSLLPVSHYIDVQIAQSNYGAPLMLSQPQLYNLALFILPGLIVLILAVRITKTQTQLSR
ncbi:MAG: ABC transporter permease [Desulfocapsa sp.]|nr:ABC transporter permease [Desulfocapsa sp.]